MAKQKYYVTVDAMGNTRWHKDAKCEILHRENGPAIEWADGSKEWLQNNQLHRENGPAVEHISGAKWWYKDGQLHRENGPAIEYADGSKSWWINDKRLTKAEFLKATQPVVEMTVADIEKLVGKRVKIVK